MTDTLDTQLDAREAELRAAKDAAYQLVVKKPTLANRTAYKRAEKELLEFIEARHAPAAEQSFGNVLELVDYLDGEGWKISKSTAYEHRDEGKIRAREDGRFYLSDVAEYARIHLQKKDGTPGGEDLGSLQQQKLMHEVNRIHNDAQLREIRVRKELGELIRRSDVEIELAKRALYLKSDLKNFFRAGAVEIIRQVGGDPQKAPALIAYGTKAVDEWLGRYARPINLGEEE